MEGATIPYNALIWDVPRGHANYLAQALQQPFLLPRDMDSIRRIKQPDLFMSLKRDLTMVSCSSLIQVFKIIFFFFFFVMLIVFLIIFVISMQVTQQVYVVEDWCEMQITNLILKPKLGMTLKSSRHSES